MLWALIALATILAGFDYSISERRLRKYGLVAEANPLTKFLCANVGLRSGLLAVIGVVHIAWSLIALHFDWITAYAFYTGYAANQGLIRYQSLELERELDKHLAGASKPIPPLR